MNTTVAPVQVSANDAAAAIVRGVTEIASAVLARTPVAPADLPALLRSISQELSAAAAVHLPGLAAPAAESIGTETSVAALETSATSESPAADPRWAGLSKTPVIPVSESVREDAIVCLFDGTPKKMLKRYIRAKYGMEEHEYKAWFGLPADYPMVAPGYAAEKATVAIAQGLGSKIDKTPRHLRVVEKQAIAA